MTVKVGDRGKGILYDRGRVQKIKDLTINETVGKQSVTKILYCLTCCNVRKYFLGTTVRLPRPKSKLNDFSMAS